VTYEGKFVVGGSGVYGDDVKFRSGAQVWYADLVDAQGGGTFRATVVEGLDAPPALATIDGTVDIRQEGDRNKIKLRLTAFTRIQGD